MDRSNNIWNDSVQQRPALVLVVDDHQSGLWAQSPTPLVSSLSEALPKHHITFASASSESSLRLALATVRFQGFADAVVVRVWGAADAPAPDLPTTGLRLGLTDAPPEAEAIVTAFHAASIPLATELQVAV